MTARRSGYFWVPRIGLLVALALCWASYAMDRSPFWALVSASAFTIGILFAGDDS